MAITVLFTLFLAIARCDPPDPLQASVPTTNLVKCLSTNETDWWVNDPNAVCELVSKWDACASKFDNVKIYDVFEVTEEGYSVMD